MYKIQPKKWVTLHQGSLPITLVAEGLETGLSLREAMPECSVVVTLGAGQLKQAAALKDKHIVLCCDNDGGHHTTQKVVEKATTALKAAGKTVWLNQPKAIKGLSKIDYNDVLKHQGAKTIRAQVLLSKQNNCYQKNNINTLKDAMAKIQKQQTPVRYQAEQRFNASLQKQKVDAKCLD